MVNTHKSLLFFGILILALSLITGCAKKETNTATSSANIDKLKAAVVTDVGGIGDMSFNAMAWEGLQRAGMDLGIETKFLESREQADYIINLGKLAEDGFDVVFAVGYLMEDAMKDVAPKYPKTKFVIIDGNAPDLPNAAALKFDEEQGSFLAGALAGAVSKTGTIGFVGGMDIPLIQKFEIGYKAGAMTTKPGIKVLAAYTGKWDDPNKGKELALAQFGRKADIVFHASGSCGLGVIDAAKSKGKGFYAIGVDADQDHIAEGSVLTSMMKRVDNAVYAICKSEVDGKFTPGDHLFGLKDDGVGLSPMKYTKKDISADVLTKVDKLKSMIIEGKLVPPKNDKELKAFNAPKI